MVTNHEMRMYALNLFEILQAVDHTLTVHGHIDCGTPLHRRITAAIAVPNDTAIPAMLEYIQSSASAGCATAKALLQEHGLR
jgi:hypothetical protein